jgi:uncharacterized protein YhbP (UPF0306 family)
MKLGGTTGNVPQKVRPFSKLQFMLKSYLVTLLIGHRDKSLCCGNYYFHDDRSLNMFQNHKKNAFRHQVLY